MTASPLAAGVVALADHALQRHVIGQRAVGDDDAGGVRAGVAVGAFQLAGDVDQLADLRVGLVRLLAGPGSASSDSSSVMPSVLGIMLVSWVTRSSGMSRTRPTSLMAARAAMVPKVAIWATLSSPYFCRT